MRTVKPQFFTSLSIAQIQPPLARLTFIGLWTYVDDEGRGVDDSRLIKAALWPLDDEITAASVESDLVALEKAGRILRYEVEGRRYLEVVNFTEHQKPNRPVPSEIPGPEQAVRPQPDETAGQNTGDAGAVSTPGAVTESAVSEQERLTAVVGGVGVDGLGGVGGEGAGEGDSLKPSPQPPRPRASRQATDTADAVTKDWWESHDPRPPNSFIGVRKVVARLIESGESPRRVRWALDVAPTPTLPALQMALHRANGHDPLAGVRQYAAEEGLL